MLLSSPSCDASHGWTTSTYPPRLFCLEPASALPASRLDDDEKCRLSYDSPVGIYYASSFIKDCHLDLLEEPKIAVDEAHSGCEAKLGPQGLSFLKELQIGQGDFVRATTMVDAMEKQGIMVPSIIFSQLLQHCIKKNNVVAGRHVHNLIIGSGCEADYMLGSSLVHMFALCGSLEEAHQGFSKLRKRNVYAWTAMIEAYAKLGEKEQAIRVYYELDRLNIELDGHVFVAVLKACSSLSTLEYGKDIHASIMGRGLDFNLYVGSALINMYATCGSLNEAYMVFDKLSERNVITWSGLIAGSVEAGRSIDALNLLENMEEEGIDPNEVTFISILKACSSLAALEKGKFMHAQILKRGFESDLYVGNTLIDMYSKCGSLNDGVVMFNRMFRQDVVTWSALLAGFAKYSNYESALDVFQSMKKLNIKPNDITYLSLLSACSHVGLVDEGCNHFKCMIEDGHGLPTLEHYNALVDILGRAGYLEEAEDLLETLPSGPNYTGWVSMLDACRLRGEVCRGKQCFDRVVAIDCQNALGYVLMSHIYARVGQWEDCNKLEQLRRCANLWKIPAKASIEVNDKIHVFIVGDIRHPRAIEIYDKLRILEVKMREEGYTVQPMMGSLPFEDNEDVVCGHSEKLAIAFGLISTPCGTTLRVAKNLRVCKDCHNASKLISRIERREIVIADAYQVHHFIDGVCCCGDMYM